MPKISIKEARHYVQERKLFETNSGTIISRQYGHLYAVFSYGEYFPMYVYDDICNQWFGNHDKYLMSNGRYSRTTSKHQSTTQPSVPDDSHIRWASTDYLQSLITAGSYVAQCANRIITKEAA